MKRIKNLLSLIALTLLLIPSVTKAQDASSIVDKMLSAMKNTKNFTSNFKQVERWFGKPIVSEYDMSLNVSPHKVYFDVKESPSPAKEILFVEGWNNNKARVDAGLANINLSPYAKLIRDKQHHTVYNAGFGTVIRIIENGKKRALAQGGFDKVFKIDGSVTFDGKPCYKLIINDPTFKYIDYTVKDGETLNQIANRKVINEYLIVEKNDDVSSYTDVSAGDVIKIPTSYAKKGIMYVDKSTYMPIYQVTYDDQGKELERYEYRNLKTNITIPTGTFDPDSDLNGF